MKVMVLFDMDREIKVDDTFSPRSLRASARPTEADVISTLQRLGHELATLPVFDDPHVIMAKLKAFQPDVVFNLTESLYLDRMHAPNIPALLELLQVRYTGATPRALLLCADKSLAKELLSFHRVRYPRFVLSRKSHPLRRIRRLAFPVFVKPVAEEASDGIAKASFAKNEEEALERAHFIHKSFRSDALIEEYAEGRELYLSVLALRRVVVFPPRELFFDDVPDDEPKFATYKSKWDDTYRKKWGIRNGAAGPLSDVAKKRLDDVARRVHHALRLDGPLRIDVRLTAADEVVVLEANPNPSLAKEDDFAQSAEAGGVPYDALIQKLLDGAHGV